MCTTVLDKQLRMRMESVVEETVKWKMENINLNSICSVESKLMKDYSLSNTHTHRHTKPALVILIQGPLTSLGLSALSVYLKNII